MRAVLVLAALAACPSPKSPAGDAPFHVFYPDAGQKGLSGKVGKRMQAKPAAACTYVDGREARWVNTGASVEEGALPPGLVLEDGAIGGVPTEAGSFSVTIRFGGVTCAGKPMGDQHVTVMLAIH